MKKRVLSVICIAMAAMLLATGCAGMQLPFGTAAVSKNSASKNSSSGNQAKKTPSGNSSVSSGQESGTETLEISENTVSEPDAAFLDSIEYCEDTYDYTNLHITDYTEKRGYNPPNGEAISDVTVFVDADSNPVKMVFDQTADGMSIEAYYINPALGRPVHTPQYFDNELVYVFATDANGGKYRLYCEGEDKGDNSVGHVLRYVGPDKEIVNFTDRPNFNDFSTKATSLDGGDMISEILSTVAPMWWIPFETD